jgi:hypothetical protein
MQTQDIVLIVGLTFNLSTLIFFIVQTRYLGAQTQALTRSIEYASYQKLIDYTNIISLQLLENEKVANVFRDIGFIKRGLEQGEQISIEKIGIAWLIINRYEAAFVGHQLRMIPEEEWEVWKRRLKKDFQIPFVREIWVHDIRNFDYNKGFKEMVNQMILDT